MKRKLLKQMLNEWRSNIWIVVELVIVLLVLQLIFLLLEHPTSDSVEIAVTVTKECGQYLSEECGEGLNRGGGYAA